MFNAILGNDPIKAYLQSAISSDRLPHALLFAGPDGIGKSLFAKALGIHLLEDRIRVEAESHPDFHAIRPEGKVGLHSIETLRRLIDDVHKAPFEGKAKVFVIHEAHRMQPAAANALLKTLEEPTRDTVIVLLTSQLQEILPTIASRCSVLRFQPLSEGEIASLGVPKHLAKRAQGSAGRAFDLAAKTNLEESVFRLLAARQGYPSLTVALEQLEKEIENEDPLKEAQAVEHLFSLVLMWRRDQEARRFGVPLFFEEGPKPDYPLAPLASVERAVDEARLAVSRNIRLSVCLEKIFKSLLVCFCFAATALFSEARYSSFVEIQASNGGQLLTLFHREPTLECCTDDDWRPWLAWTGNWLRIGTQDDQIGFLAKTQGFASGVDRKIGDYWSLGGGVAWDHTSLELHAKNGTGQTNRYLGALYTDFEMDPFYCGLSFYGGLNTNDLNRRLFFPDLSARGDFHSADLGAQFATAYLFRYSTFLLSPYANVDYLYFNGQHFRESGAGSYSLAVNSHSSGTIRSAAGISWQMLDSNLEETICVAPSLALGWSMVCPVGRPLYTVSFVDDTDTFQIKGWNQTWQLFSLDFRLAFTFYCFGLSGEYYTEFWPKGGLSMYWAQWANIAFQYSW